MEGLTRQEGCVFNIQRYTIHDGPGIRTEIFLKGCPLHCIWCSNPEGIHRAPEVGVRASRCIGTDKCGLCIGVCPQSSRDVFVIKEKKVIGINREVCSGCLSCAEKCPADALKAWGKRMSIPEAMRVVMTDKPFYDNSGGGVTLSGGEPLVQWRFVRGILEQCRERGVHTCVETAMMIHPDILDEILPLADLIICDIKHMDPDKHRAYTGVSNGLILDNIRKTVNLGKPTVIRIPVIPGHNDSRENIIASAVFVAEELNNRIRQLQLLRYRKLGEEKYEALGIAYPMGDFKAPAPEAGENDIRELAALMREYGVPAVAGTTTPY